MLGKGEKLVDPEVAQQMAVLLKQMQVRGWCGCGVQALSCARQRAARRILSGGLPAHPWLAPPHPC